MSDHNDQSETNESDCPHLHVEMDYSVRTYQMTKGAREFREWYERVFSVQHPNSKGDFTFDTTEFEGEEMMELSRYHPSWTIDSLEALFEDSRTVRRDEGDMDDFEVPKGGAIN